MDPPLSDFPDSSSLYRSAAGFQETMAHYNRSLQRMGIPHETRLLETTFGTTHAVVSGNRNGKALVLWHGLNANSSTWAGWMPALGAMYRLYAIDTIGGLGKSAPKRLPRKGPAYGQWAREAIEKLGLRRANMIGASNGGWLIVKLASVAPELIGSAVLMSPSGFTRIRLLHLLRMLPRVLFKPPEDVARATWTSLSPSDAEPDPAILELLELIAKHYRGEPFPTVLSDAEVSRLTAPTCLMMGQYEVLVNPYKSIEGALRLLPNAVAAGIVPGVGHAIAHRELDRVCARVTGFLESYAV